MKRRVIQIANSTQLISLPRKWALENNIRKGDELEITLCGNSLTVGGNPRMQDAAVELDISGLDRTSVMFNIRAAYRRGFDKITVRFSNPTTRHYRSETDISLISIIHTEVNRLVGIEIVEEGHDTCVLRDLQTTASKDFNVVMKRIFLLLKSTTEELVVGAREGDMISLGTIDEKHDTITKFVSYCLRSLHKFGYMDTNKTPPMYNILANLDVITDIVKYSSRDVIAFDHAVSKETHNILERISDSVSIFHELYYKFDHKKVNRLSEHRDMVLKRIKSAPKSIPSEELLLLNNMEHICELIRDLVGAVMGLQL
jgi:phosphate uptake regulator